MVLCVSGVQNDGALTPVKTTLALKAGYNEAVTEETNKHGFINVLEKMLHQTNG